MEKITHENWPKSWRDVEPFTEVSEEVYEDMLDALPPIYLYSSPYCGFQMGEPHCTAADEHGRWRNQYLTFVHVGNRFYYAGINFGGECKHRMTEQHEE